MVGDRGVSSMGDVDQLQGSHQLDHILVSGELLFTVTRLLNDDKDLASAQAPASSSAALAAVARPTPSREPSAVGS
jgi:hypothetical protein